MDARQPVKLAKMPDSKCNPECETSVGEGLRESAQETAPTFFGLGFGIFSLSHGSSNDPLQDDALFELNELKLWRKHAQSERPEVRRSHSPKIGSPLGYQQSQSP